MNYQISNEREDEFIENSVAKDKKSDVPQSEIVKLNNLKAISRTISKILFYFKQNQIDCSKKETNKRFPKFLTKYQLFRDQVLHI